MIQLGINANTNKGRDGLYKTFVVLIVLFALTLTLAYVTEIQNKHALDKQLNREAHQIVSDFEAQYVGLQKIAGGVAGLFEASTSVSKQEWQTYIKFLELEQAYPYITFIGVQDIDKNFIYKFTLGEVEDSRELYIASVFSNNREVVLGFDIVLLMENIDRTLLSSINVSVVNEQNNTLFSSLNNLELPTQKVQQFKTLHKDIVVDIAGENYTFKMQTKPDFGAGIHRYQPMIIMFVGGIISMALFAYAWLLAIDRRKAEMRAYEMVDLFRLFIEHTPAAIAIFDRDICYMAHSQRWLKDYGLVDENLIGKCHYDVFPEIFSDKPEWLDDHRRALKGEVVQHERDMFTRADGSYEYLRYEIRPWTTASGDIGGIIMFTELITQQVEAQANLENTVHELTQSNIELEKFAYIASHDLKSPLRGIDNLAKWIDDDLSKDASSDTKEKLSMMRGRIHRLERLLDDILTYSKAGKIMDEPENIDTLDVVKRIVDDNQIIQNFTVELPEYMPVLMTPRTPFEQVFTNLLVNAVKHHDTGHGVIGVECVEQQEYYEFVVRDDGPGIPKDFHSKVFEMFQTLKSRDVTEGTGLGMSIIKKLVEWQGGKVWLQSPITNGRGAAIHFTWPKTIGFKQIERKRYVA